MCGSSHKAKFGAGSHTVLDMCVPREKAVKIETTKEELETAASKRQKKEGEEDAPAPLEVPFATCLETFTQESIIEDYYSPAIQMENVCDEEDVFENLSERVGSVRESILRRRRLETDEDGLRGERSGKTQHRKYAS